MAKFVVAVLVACILTMTSSEPSTDNSYAKYKFGFNTGDIGDHTRVEEADGSGHVNGMYSYVDPNGVLRKVRYNSAPGVGYHAYGDGITQFGSAVPSVLDREQYSAVDAVRSAHSDVELPSSNDISNQNSNFLDNAISDVIYSSPSEIVSKMNLEGYSVVDLMQSPISNAETVTENRTIYEESDVLDNEISNTIVDESESSLVLTDNSTTVESKPIPESKTVGNSSDSTVRNHQILFPFLFPYSPYKLPVPFVYVIPSVFTYNVLAPHYKLVL